MANPSPGAKAHPEHKIRLERTGEPVRVTFAGETIAETTNAITLHEATYPPVLYIPMTDVVRDRLTPTELETRCPFKGRARYWTVSAKGNVAENAAWAYDDPYDEVAEIAGHVAFYPDKVAIAVG